MAVRDATTTDLYSGSPFGQYQRVEVTFPSTANLDTVDAALAERRSTPNTVEYQVLKSERSRVECLLTTQSATRKAWGSLIHCAAQQRGVSQKVTLLTHSAKELHMMKRTSRRRSARRTGALRRGRGALTDHRSQYVHDASGDFIERR
jgi:phage FluMu protein gp41